MNTRQISAELRVMCDTNLVNNIHDRWILSKDMTVNVPPIDTIFKGQYSEMKKTNNRPPFEDWWSKAFDIMKQWQDIQKCVPKT